MGEVILLLTPVLNTLPSLTDTQHMETTKNPVPCQTYLSSTAESWILLELVSH